MSVTQKNHLSMYDVYYWSAFLTDIYYSRLLLNQNKSGKLNTFKTYLKEPIFSTTDIYSRRLPKGHEPIFWFKLPTDQLLIFYIRSNLPLLNICGFSVDSCRNLVVERDKFLNTPFDSFFPQSQGAPDIEWLSDSHTSALLEDFF